MERKFEDIEKLQKITEQKLNNQEKKLTKREK